MKYKHSIKRPASDARRLVILFSIVAILALLLFSGSLRRSSQAKSISSSIKQSQNSAAITGAYQQSNLVSDLPGVALVEDPQLKNPWGVALKSGTAFWVVNNKTDRASLYKGDVPVSPLASSPLALDPLMPFVAIPTVPTVAPAPSQPTAITENSTNDFSVSLTPTSPAAPAQFITAAQTGGINAWQPLMGSVAVVVKFMSGHRYTGIAIGTNASGNFLFVADFANGNIDVFDKDFNVSSVPGNFADASIPANFHPYNIQNLGGSLYVTYAEFQHGPNFDNGFVRKFDTNGVRDTTFAINNGPLLSPWGMVIAPANFGAFSNALLVGNSRLFGNHMPTINAFNPATGALLGNMVDEGGTALEIPGLHGLVFGNGINAGDTNTLYFAAGIESEAHGLFGSLKASTAGPTSQIQFSQTDYFTTENAGHFDITVTRTGDVSTLATVHYATVDAGAGQKFDYEIALGKLTFLPGETSKTFRVLIVDNNMFGAGTSHDVKLVLSNALGAALVTPKEARLAIMDNEFDTPGQPPNILDTPQFFVRQQYFDFLNREPDPAGFNFWVNQITSCGTNAQCIDVKRIHVSAAFFLSIEFQKTGMTAYLTEKTAFGGLPRYGQFMLDVQALQKDYVFGAPGAEQQLEANKQAFFDEFVTRPAFAAKYNQLSNEAFVSELFANAQLNTTTAELFIAQLTGSQVVPPTGSPATGLVVLRQAPSGPNFSLALSFGGLTSAETEAHLHGPAAANANGPIIFTLPGGQVRNFQSQLSTAQSIDLSRGLLYVDVHTTNFPNGEIRGQLPSNRFVIDMIIRSLDAGIISRPQALRLITESDFLRINELNRAFVLMEYFGYLRRNPDDPPDTSLAGFNFWLAKLNQFNGDFIKAEMVKAFISSSEYRTRFGP